MPTPAPWDDKSWSDVCAAREHLERAVKHLRELEGEDQPDPAAVRWVLERIASTAQAGASAAAWCEQ